VHLVKTIRCVLGATKGLVVRRGLWMTVVDKLWYVLSLAYLMKY